MVNGRFRRFNRGLTLFPPPRAPASTGSLPDMPSPSRKRRSAAVAPVAAPEPATPPAPAAAPKAAWSGAEGDSASPDAIARLRSAVASQRAEAAAPVLREALACVQGDRDREAVDLALQALELDERNGLGWYVLAISLEKCGDFAGSLQAYEKALQLIPEYVEIANDLGRLAYRLGMAEQAEKLFAWYFVRNPDSADAANNLACVLRDGSRYEDAVEVLRPAIMAAPENAMLWNTLGTVLYEQGDMVGAQTFLDEAVRVDPAFPKARYNRANARLAQGDTAGAIEDADAAIPHVRHAADVSMMRLARATMWVADGQLGRGWDGYEERLNRHYADATLFAMDQPQWTPDADLRGRTLLVFGEQGLGDEVLFANLLPDLLDALAPYGRLILAVERRLVPLFQRSFPQAQVGEHVTAKVGHHVVRTALFLEDAQSVDLWAPLGSLLRRFRRDVADFPTRDRFLVPDPERVAHWRGVLDAAGPEPKVGLLWKSGVSASARSRYYAPFDAWAPVLRTPGVRFVTLQYGDCSEELARARSAFGADVLVPPGIDLKQDQDDLAALCAACDLVIGPANASTNIAGAVGTPLWLISTPGAWPRLGTDRYPWYPQARVFAPPAYNAWDGVMAEVAAALADWRAARG